jgi:4-amino-4-deoxy-L-arabinose transferase-like glycosyltransferase
LREKNHRTIQGEKRGFGAALRDVLDRYSKRTSVPHKRSVFLLILGGALLRGWMLLEPITYDEARAFDLFTGRSLSILLSEHTDPLNHIFHGLLAKLSMWFFGTGTVALRLPAFMAGILVMPLFYLFTRAMFNRYIALLGLALVASSAPLIEAGTLAHGYSITWLCMMLGFVFGRHFLKVNNLISAILIGVVLALGMWTMTAMIYPAATIYIYLFIYILLRYEGSIKKRLGRLGLSFLVFVLLTLLLYLPVIINYGLGILIDHPSLPERSWKDFSRQHQDGAFELWVAIADTTGTAIALAGIAALLAAAYVSTKYRSIMFAAALGSIPLVLMQARVAPPPVWFYMLFLFHIGSAIALFYLLKFIQEKFITSLGKRQRTTVTGTILFIGLSYLGMMEIIGRMDRYPEAENAGAYLREAMEPGDKAYADHPLDAPVRFHARANGIPREYFHGPPAPDAWAFIIVVPTDHQPIPELLATQRVRKEEFDSLRMVMDREGMEIFAARYLGDPFQGDAR